MNSLKLFRACSCKNFLKFADDFNIINRTVTTSSICLSSVSSRWSTSAKTHDWNRAVSDAEKIVGYSTTFFSVKCLLSEEFTNVAMQLRKLVGTNHPVLKTAKRLVYNGRSNLQTRGLIVLLLSKAAGHVPTCSDLSTIGESGVTARQQTLAEITEMIHTAHLIHKGILNLSGSVIPEENTEHEDLQLGNKISILSGDYLLANACKGLANLRNCKVVDLISKSIADFMQAEFLGDYDREGNPLPVRDMNLATWEEKNILSGGSLLANSCKGTLALAGHEEPLQTKAYELGKNIGLAWQVYSELQPFVGNLACAPGSKFDLDSLPVIFYLENHPEKVDIIRQELKNSIADFDFKSLHSSIVGDDSVAKTKDLLHQYSQKAEDLLPLFGSSAATKALSNIINSLRI